MNEDTSKGSHSDLVNLSPFSLDDAFKKEFVSAPCWEQILLRTASCEMGFKTQVCIYFCGTVGFIKKTGRNVSLEYSVIYP